MTTWEYAYLKFHSGGNRRAKLFFDGKPASRSQGDEADLLQLLNSLGRDGWEAISHTYDFPTKGGEENEQWMSILLKRPVN